MKKALLDFPVRRFREHRQDILETLVEIAWEGRPDLVICPSFADIHQDHQVVCEECQRAFRQSTILGWEPLTIHRESRLDTYIAISPEALATKIEIWDCYRSQHGRSYLDDQLLRSLAVVRGKQARIESGLAEAYEVIRAIRA